MPAGTSGSPLKRGFTDSYPAQFRDGRQLLLPIRVLPGDGTKAVASLIINQASFAVEDALAEALTREILPFAADVVIGVPTLGLPLAANVARLLGHGRMVALGTSRKFWYQDELSEPMSSITSPAHAKSIFIDPRMLPLLEGKRVALIEMLSARVRRWLPCCGCWTRPESSPWSSVPQCCKARAGTSRFPLGGSVSWRQSDRQCWNERLRAAGVR